MDFVSKIFKNIFIYMRFLFLEQLSCRTKPYDKLDDTDFHDIESINFNKMER